MENKYAPLFQPVALGGLRLKNRIVLSPMTTRLAGPGHEVSERMIDYLEARARGGAAMVTTEAFYVARRFGGNNTVELDSNEKVPGLTALAEAVHAWDCKLCVQLGCGLGRYDGFGPGGAPPKTASPIPAYAKPEVLCEALTEEEIAQIVREYGRAAQRAVRAGADAINIHGHNGYLIDQFMSAQFNHRTDGYGGSLEHRMRYPGEIVAAVRKAVGPSVPVIFRFSVDLKYPGSRGLAESVDMLLALQETGIDALDLDTGATESMDWIFLPCYHGEGCARYVAEAARKGGVKLPILNSGCHDPDTALDALASGAVDCVMLGRSLIADPDLPNKLRAGRAGEVRPCLRCNGYCTRRSISSGAYVTCAVNAAAGNERRFAPAPARERYRVAVVGGGPAGMECARVAALRGHGVTLYEASDALGGAARVYAAYGFRGQTAAYLAWQRRELDRLGVRVVLGRRLTADSPELAEADRILAALGTEPSSPGLPGMDRAVDLRALDPASVRGRRVVVLGGALRGCELAAELAGQGNQVTVAEEGGRLAADCYGINRTALCQLMEDRGVTGLTGCRSVEIGADGVTVEERGIASRTLEADLVVSTLGDRPCRWQTQAILDRYGARAAAVGACQHTGNLGAAVRDAYFAANRL